MPEELTNAQGQLVWQASYKTWGATVAEEWEAKTLAGQDPIETGDKPNSEQNLRFQGQYLDRSTGLHYNTFRYYDADIGRFICPDPIGLQGGINLASYAPNPISWIDPWGLEIVYRGMSQGEYNDLNRTGTWSSNGTMEGKWFATTYEDAVTWGKRMGHGGDFIVVQVDIPNDLNVYRNPNLDGIGPAIFIENSDLNSSKVNSRWKKSVKCNKK